MKGQWMVQAVKPERIEELAGSRQYSNRASHATIMVPMDRFRDIRYFWIGRSGPIGVVNGVSFELSSLENGCFLTTTTTTNSLILTVKSVTDGW
jgi:hypothetical protein